jgi:collagenase-like PrtC family protease
MRLCLSQLSSSPKRNNGFCSQACEQQLSLSELYWHQECGGALQFR